MTVALPIVLSERHRRHDVRGQIRIGVRAAGTGVPGGADRMRATVQTGATVVGLERHRGADLAPHGAALLEDVPALGALGILTVLLEEGDYEVTTIGALVDETLNGLQEGLPRG